MLPSEERAGPLARAEGISLRCHGSVTARCCLAAAGQEHAESCFVPPRSLSVKSVQVPPQTPLLCASRVAEIIAVPWLLLCPRAWPCKDLDWLLARVCALLLCTPTPCRHHGTCQLLPVKYAVAVSPSRGSARHLTYVSPAALPAPGPLALTAPLAWRSLACKETPREPQAGAGPGESFVPGSWSWCCPASRPRLALDPWSPGRALWQFDAMVAFSELLPVTNFIPGCWETIVGA